MGKLRDRASRSDKWQSRYFVYSVTAKGLVKMANRKPENPGTIIRQLWIKFVRVLGNTLLASILPQALYGSNPAAHKANWLTLPDWRFQYDAAWNTAHLPDNDVPKCKIKPLAPYHFLKMLGLWLQTQIKPRQTNSAVQGFSVQILCYDAAPD